MRDELGLCYHAQAGNSKACVYVRKGPDGDIQFCFWYADYPELREKHGRLDMDIISQAAVMCQTECSRNADSIKFYDPAIAKSMTAAGEWY